MNVVVRYSCRACGLRRQDVEVPARGEEDVLVWMECMGYLISRDHEQRSPTCKVERLSDVMIPTTGTQKIGGPVVN